MKSGTDSSSVSIHARARDDDAAERALAEAVEAGASGAEQRGEEGGVTLIVYAPAAAASAVRDSLARVLSASAVGAPEPVAPIDWSEAWKEGLRPIEVSERLRIRTSFEPSAPRAGQRDLVIDPGQAFGTGGHESTRLALAWIGALGGELAAAPGVLDVGTGTGVLALAALALGAPHAVGLDVDPLATSAARANALANGLAGLGLVTGPLDALERSVQFAGVIANLLSRELDPLFERLASQVAPGGWLAISGLLESERATWEERGRRAGLAIAGSRRETDTSGTEWASLFMRRAPRRAGG